MLVGCVKAQELTAKCAQHILRAYDASYGVVSTCRSDGVGGERARRRI